MRQREDGIAHVVIRRTRLTFLRDVIEPLAPHERIRFETNDGVFEIRKEDAQTVFPGVFASRSYRHNGYYNYATIPKKAARFRVDAPTPKDNRKTAPMTNGVQLPSFLSGKCPRAKYLRWLRRRAVAHVRRDQSRGNLTCRRRDYEQAIHEAVIASRGVDAYTGEQLDWSLLSRYDNAESKAGQRHYKARFAMLPTVDHVGDGNDEPTFVICAWRTNDGKNDLSLDEFTELCRKVLAHQGWIVKPPS